MISLPVGVRIVKFHDAEMQKVGKGVLYLLSNGIMFEKKGEGAKFECNFEYLASYEAVKKDKLLVVIRTPQGRKSVEFKVDTAKQVEDDISKVNQEYANSVAPDQPNSENGEKQDKFDQDAHSRLEAKWFQENWDKIMKFLKPERVAYLNEYVKNAKTGSPGVDPYLLVVDYENFTYKDFTDLEGFLKWRYEDMTNKDLKSMISLLQDFGNLSISAIEMQIQRASKSKNYLKTGQSLYERVVQISREASEKIKNKNV